MLKYYYLIKYTVSSGLLGFIYRSTYYINCPKLSSKRFIMNQIQSKLLTLLSLASRLSYLYLLTAFWGIGFHYSYAQTTEVDSLLTKLSTANMDSERITIMNALSNKLTHIDSKKALIYAQKALKLSQQTNDKENEIKSLFNAGILVYDSPNKDSALVYFETGEKMADELGFGALQADHLMKLAQWYRYHRVDSTKTVNYLLKSVKVSKSANYNYGTGRSYAKLASFYTRYNQIDLSEKYLKLSAEYYMLLENGGEEVAHYYDEVGNKIWDYNPKKSMDFYLKGLEYSDTYPNIKVSLAKAYSTIGEPEKALKYLQPALSNLRKMRYTRMLGIGTALLAQVYVELGDYEAADKICDEGIALLSPLSRSKQRALPGIYSTKGLVLEYKGNDKAALEYYTKSLEEGNRIGASFQVEKSNLIIGKFYSSRNPQKGKLFCQKTLQNAQINNYINLEIDACDCLYKIYKEEASYANALKYYEQKTALSDSLSTLNVEHVLDVNGKMAQKDKQLAEQAYQKEIKEEQLRNQYRLNTTLFISSLFGLLLIGFLTLSIRRISRQNKEITKKTEEIENANLNLERSNEELERFAYVASHDLKSPLNNIISFTGLLRRNLHEEQNPIVEDSLNFIENSGKRMTQLIEDVLEYSKLSSQITDEQEIIKLNDLVEEISLLAQNTPDGKQVTIETSALPNVKWNYSKIFLLFKNIIENGIKYNKSEQPIIKLSCVNTRDRHSVYIQDNGIGIKKEFYDEVFIMFKRLHTQGKYEGTGLGLATCKKIVDEFEGEISISSELGKGTVFKIEFPKHLIYQHSAMELVSS